MVSECNQLLPVVRVGEIRCEDRTQRWLIEQLWGESSVGVIGGAPNRPSDSTFQPARSSTAWRAAASAVKLEIVAPVTNPPVVPGGKSNSSLSHASAIRSSRATPGVEATKAAF